MFSRRFSYRIAFDRAFPSLPASFEFSDLHSLHVFPVLLIVCRVRSSFLYVFSAFLIVYRVRSSSLHVFSIECVLSIFRGYPLNFSRFVVI